MSTNFCRKFIFIAIAIFFGTSFTAVSFTEDLKIGTKAFAFKVKSGDNKIITLDMIKERVIVIFYETKGVVGKNRKLKDELNKFYNEQPEDIKKVIVRLPVIDCSSAFWPFTRIWERNLVENSKKEGVTIYGDWDGKMKSTYRMRENESNVMIIDKKGIVRYITSGKIKDKEINEIKERLRSVGNEEETTSPNNG